MRQRRGRLPRKKNRASASGGSGGSNLTAMFADVSSSFRQVCRSISASTSSQAALTPTPRPVPLNVSTIDAALELFTLEYSRMFSASDRLSFKKSLTDNDKIPGVFLR